MARHQAGSGISAPDIAANEQQAVADARHRSQQSRRITPGHQRTNAQHEGMGHAVPARYRFGVDLGGLEASAIDSVVDDANALGRNAVALDQVAAGAR